MKNLGFFWVLICLPFFCWSQGSNPTIPIGDTAAIVMQYMNTLDTNFYYIQDLANDYIKNGTPSRKFLKNYARWEMFWMGRVGSTGDFDTPMHHIINMASNNVSVCSNDGNWQQLGPYVTEARAGIIVSVHTSDNGNTIYAGSNTGGLWKRTQVNGNYQWECMTDDDNTLDGQPFRMPGLGVNQIVESPPDANGNTTLYITTGHNYTLFVIENYGIGLLKSTDGGQNWTTTSLDLPLWTWRSHSIDRLVMHPQDPNTMYALGQGGLYVTYDGWDSHINLADAVNSDLSTIYNSSSFIDFEFLPSDPNIIFATTTQRYSAKGQLYKGVITNGANGFIYNWSNITLPNTPNYATKICLVETSSEDQSAKDKVYVHFLEYDIPTNQVVNRPLYYYDNNTGIIDNATLLNSDLTFQGGFQGMDFGFTGFEVHPKNAQIMYLPIQTLWRSVDEGNSFTEISSYNQKNTHADVRQIQILNPAPNTIEDNILMGTDGGVNIDGNSPIIDKDDWINISGTDLIVTQFFDIANSSSHPNIIAGGAQDNGVYNGNNTGWNNAIIGDGGQTAINWSNNNAYARGNGSIFRYDVTSFSFPGSSFNLNNLSPYNPPVSPGFDFWDYAKIEVDQKDGDKLYFAKYTVFGKLSNINASPIVDYFYNFNTTYGIPSNNKIQTFEIAPSDPNIIYLSFAHPEGTGVTPRFFKSTDGGQNWTNLHINSVTNLSGNDININFLGGKFITSIAVDPLDEGHLWVCLSGFNPKNPSTTTNQGIFRILEGNTDENGNITWKDISHGLTPTMVNKIVYQRGTDNVLYAGTDIGVYRYDKASGVWECFNNGLPAAIIFDLEIDYCQGLLHAGTFGRGIWESPLAPTNPEQITTNTLWEDGIYNAANDIIVKAGVRLTLKNCILNMAKDRSIIVEEGAELIIDGATLTNRCGDWWQGISVFGDKNESQYGNFPNRHQGYVRLINGATIEHAEEGIRTWDAFSGTLGGGIVKATDAIFRNNWRDVEMMKYEYPASPNTPNQNVSWFKNCTFELTDDYRQPNEVNHRVTLWGVTGVDFKGCTFVNNSTTIQANRNIAGIYTIDAGFEVEEGCAIPVPSGSTCPVNKILPSTFTNFYYGIRGSAASPTTTFKVDKTAFTGNVLGVYGQGVNDLQVTNNTFSMGNGYQPYQQSVLHNTGVHINTGTGYQIQENTFTGISGYTAPQTVGVYINETKEDNNKVRKNTMTGLAYANMAYGNNRSSDPNASTGLQFLCNTQTNNDFDIYVWGDASGIRNIQGENFQTNPISDGNRFSLNGGTESDYFIDDDIDFPINRLYKQGITSAYAQDFSFGLTQTIVNTENCGSQLNDGDIIIYDPEPPCICRSGVIGQFYDHQTNYQVTTYLHDNLMDGGDQQEMLDDIIFEWSDDAWEMRNELLSESPNLSQDVLLEAAYTGILPDVLLMEVLLANPRSIKDKEFIAVLENDIPNPLPSYLTDLLLVAQEPASLRANLENQMAHHRWGMSENGRWLVQHAIKDTMPIDTVTYWLTQLNTLHSSYNKAEYLLKKGQSSAGLALLNTLPNLYADAERFNEEHQAYIQLYNMKANFQQNDKTWLDLTASDISQLQYIAYSTNADAAIQARNILCFFTEECFDGTLLPNGVATGRATPTVINANLALDQYFTALKVYPNPADAFVTFEYNLPLYLETANLVVSDISGKIVHQSELNTTQGQHLLDTRNIGQGLYFYSLKNAKGQTLVTGKLSVIK